MTTPYEASVELYAGDEAPQFSLPAYPNGQVVLADVLKENKVLVQFYYDDSNPVSADEMKQLSDAAKRFAAEGTVVLCVSRNSLQEHERFAQENALEITLLSDADGAICRAYGALRGDRQKPDSIAFVIDRAGIIQHVAPANPDVEKLLDTVRMLRV